METQFEATALSAPSEIDGRALMWTYESLDEDRELEQFFSGIPGFCSSKVVPNPQSSLDGLRNMGVAYTLHGFLERTWTSDLISETVKIWRLVTCIRAIDAAYLSDAAYRIIHEFFWGQPAFNLFESVELGHSLMSRGNNENKLFAQGIIACIIAEAPQPNERWFSLTCITWAYRNPSFEAISTTATACILPTSSTLLASSSASFPKPTGKDSPYHTFFVGCHDGATTFGRLYLSYNMNSASCGMKLFYKAVKKMTLVF
jgi:hypothetical protein